MQNCQTWQCPSPQGSKKARQAGGLQIRFLAEPIGFVRTTDQTAALLKARAFQSGGGLRLAVGDEVHLPRHEVSNS